MAKVFILQESVRKRDGLLPHVDVCATLEAAFTTADRRAGVFALRNEVEPWNEPVPTEPGRRWRHVPAFGYQHIYEQELIGS